MHDLYAAQDVLGAALKTAQQKNLKKITKVVIDLGTIADHGDEITDSNLVYNFKLLAKSTIAADARIVINRIKGNSCILKEIEGNK